MASMLSVIDITSTATMIAGIKAALQAKSLITSVLYESTSALIFSTPLTSKVIKIAITSGSYAYTRMYYGDAWTSGTTITNEVQFNGGLTGGASFVYMNVVADTTFFEIYTQASSNHHLGYVGSLSNGDELVFGLCSSTYYANSGRNITDGTQLRPIGFNGLAFKNVAGNLVSMPLYWFNIADRVLEMNGANFAETVGVKICSHVPGLAIDSGPSFFTTASTLADGSGQVLYNSLLFDLG